MVDLRGLLSCQTRHIPARTRSNRDKWLFPPITSLFVGGHPVSGRDRHTLSEDDDMSMAKSVCVVFSFSVSYSMIVALIMLTGLLCACPAGRGAVVEAGP